MIDPGSGHGAAPTQGLDPEVATAHPTPRFLVAVMLGTGYGWADGTVDLLRPAEFEGWSSARLLHIAPELGLYVKPRLLLSIQVRRQTVSGASSFEPGLPSACGGDGLCSGQTSAVAVFAKVSRIFGRADEPLRPYQSVAIGRGSIRHLAPNAGIPVCGRGDQDCVDTIAGGPWLLALGAGLRYRLVGQLDAVAAVDLQLAGTNWMANVDASLGAAAWF